MITLGSLFDGIGGWQLAAVRNGVQPLWSSEIDPFPASITKKHFPDTIQLGDVTKIDGAEIAPVDIICAGSPCQDLSIAGKRAGLEGERSKQMKLKELVNKIDNDIVLWIVRAPDTNVLFKRKHPFDVIPEDVLCMEVGTFFPIYNRLYIEVKRNSRKGSFRELLNRLNNYDCIDVYVVNHDGTKEKIYSEQAVLRINEEYDDCLVKRISPHESEWGDKLEIVIEPCEEEEEKAYET